MMPKILRSTSILYLATSLLVMGCGSGSTSPPDHPQIAAGVTMRDVTFFSSALNRDMPYRVFLPDTVAAGQKLPVVYLLHGGGGNFRDWSNDSDVSRYAQQEIILVMPEGYSSYFTNSALKPADKYQDYLINDLISDVEKRFPAAGNRENRAIVGVSMGGYAAIKLALSRPDLFTFVGAVSPAIDVPSRRFNWRRASQSWRFRTIFGPEGSATRVAEDPFFLVRSANPAATPYLYVTSGRRSLSLDRINGLCQSLVVATFSMSFIPSQVATTGANGMLKFPAVSRAWSSISPSQIATARQRIVERTSRFFLVWRNLLFTIKFPCPLPILCLADLWPQAKNAPNTLASPPASQFLALMHLLRRRTGRRRRSPC